MKENVADMVGTKVFVIVAREMQTPRNDTTRLPSTDGGGVVREFEEAPKPHLRSELKAKMQNLEGRTKNERTKRIV